MNICKQLTLSVALGVLVVSTSASAQMNDASKNAAMSTSHMSDAEFATHYGTMDKNGDGMISRAEYLEYYGSRYDRFDSSKRGSLDRKTMRDLSFEREVRKTDGNPLGNSPQTPTKR